MGRQILLLITGIIAAIGLVLGGWFLHQKQQRRAVLAAYGHYERTLKMGDPALLKPLVTGATAKELDAADAGAKLALAAALRPANYGIAGVELGWSSALLRLEGGGMRAMVDLEKEDGVWKVSKEAWTMNLGNEPSLPAAKVSRSVRAWLDRMAGSDPVDGGRAWKELAASTNNPDTYFESVRGAFDDPRPIAFRVDYISNVGPDGVHRSGYTPSQEAAGSGETHARTVGECLRLDMWRMEGMGLAANPKPFGPWWAEYRRARGLGDDPVAASPSIAMNPSPGTESGTGTGSGSGPGEVEDIRDPAIPATGEATGTVDGQSVRFLLATGFFSDTKADKPTRMMLEFRLEGAKRNSNPRRVKILVDATRTGEQAAEGISGFRATEEMRGAGFTMIENGGQLFPPRGPCVVRVTSPYTGNASSRLEGEVPEVEIHSAGITKRIAVRFKVEGSLAKAPR